MVLNGQTAIVSGGMGDIGRAIAKELVRQGADVALGDLLPDAEAESFLKDLRITGQQARYDQCDVSDASAVQQWVASVEASLGTPTLIIPNAAVVTLANTQTVTPEQWNREININLNGAFYMAQAGAQRLLASGKPGRIVFVGSWAAHAPHTHIPAYCAAKAGLRMLCKCMAVEYAPNDILVNEVAPGYVNAGLSRKIFDEFPERRRAADSKVPVHRLIEAEEVAVQVAHLCSPTNRHITGSVLLMDGGLSLVSPATQTE